MFRSMLSEELESETTSHVSSGDSAVVDRSAELRRVLSTEMMGGAGSDEDGLDEDGSDEDGSDERRLSSLQSST